MLKKKGSIPLIPIQIFIIISLLAVYLKVTNKTEINTQFFEGSKNVIENITQIEADPLDDLVKSATQDFEGTYAIYIKDLKSGKAYESNSSLPFRSASLYKLAVMYKTFDALEKGEIKVDDYVSGNKQTLDALISGQELEQDTDTQPETIYFDINTALELMITVSDNHSALLLADSLGWANIDKLMDEEGFGEINLLKETPEVTARAVGTLLEKIYNNQAVSYSASVEMKNLLFAQQVNNRIPKYLPVDVKVAHKTGELEGIRNDAGIVIGQIGHYIFVFLSNTQDPEEASENIASLSKQFYDALEAKN